MKQVNKLLTTVVLYWYSNETEAFNDLLKKCLIHKILYLKEQTVLWYFLLLYFNDWCTLFMFLQDKIIIKIRKSIELYISDLYRSSALGQIIQIFFEYMLELAAKFQLNWFCQESRKSCSERQQFLQLVEFQQGSAQLELGKGTSGV